MRTALLLLLLTLLLTACGSNTTPPSSAADNGSEEEFRIAALAPAIAVILRDLGHEDTIVARHDFDLICPDSIPKAGSSLGWDLEALIAARPTHLIMQRSETAPIPGTLTAAADEHGWTIMARPLDTLDDVANLADDLHYLIDGPPERDPTILDPTESLAHTQPSERLARAWRDRGPIADRAGRVLILGSLDPPAAMGPGSFHHQLITRMGMTPAITDGAMWIELDYEGLIALAPDAILVFSPRQRADDARFGLPEPTIGNSAFETLGPIADLPIPAIDHERVAVIDHPLALLPSTALADVALEIERVLGSWDD
jgi:ABC-type Fe3+-hydroxamate transport system substrate-binding protein